MATGEHFLIRCAITYDVVFSNSTFTSGFSARRRATTDPEEPDPHTMKSYCAFKPAVRRAWLLRTRSLNSTSAASNSTPVFTLRTSFFILRCYVNDNSKDLLSQKCWLGTNGS